MRRSIAAVSVAVLAGALLTGAVTPVSAAPTGSPGVSDPVARAGQVLDQWRGAVRASVGDEFTVRNSQVDAGGSAHVRYDRTYRGLRVSGGDFVVHLAADGGFDGVSVGLVEPLAVDVTPRVGTAQARKVARSRFAGAVARVGVPELFIDASSGVGRLAWDTVVEGLAADGQTPSRLHVITDATTGKFLTSYDDVQRVEGTGHSIYSGTVTIHTTYTAPLYYMIDPEHGGNTTCDYDVGSCEIFTDADNIWGDGTQSNRQSAGVDAHYGAAMTYDYFKNVHGRNGIFGDGRGVPSRVHYGSNYSNAFWDGSRMTYGDGAGDAKPLVSLDVAGHEMSHGVTEATAGLIYSGESGGLNEATSDIFGNMVEFYADNVNDPGDYTVGEKIDIFGNGEPLRYMYSPGLDGVSHACWSTSTKSVDVHYSSGVANHFFFLLAEGSGATRYGTSPVCGTAPAVTGIGRTKAERIWWRALSLYFTSTTSYVNTSNPNNTARAYTLRATTDLYGFCSTEYRTVQAAWTAVNVAGSDAPCAVGDDFIVSTSPTSNLAVAGSSVRTTVATHTTAGSAQAVNLFAFGLPAGATASFSPASVTSGGSSTLTISTGATTPPGSYTITITGIGTSVTRYATFRLTVDDACQPRQLLGNPGFETGSAPWSAPIGVIGSWSGQSPHSGTRFAWLAGYGQSTTHTLTQTVTLPAGCASYDLRFWLHIDTAETAAIAYDTLRVQVLSDSGTVLGTLATYSNLNAAPGYQQRSFNVAPYAGRTVQLRFLAVEDFSHQTSFVVDDTSLNIS